MRQSLFVFILLGLHVGCVTPSTVMLDREPVAKYNEEAHYDCTGLDEVYLGYGWHPYTWWDYAGCFHDCYYDSADNDYYAVYLWRREHRTAKRTGQVGKWIRQAGERTRRVSKVRSEKREQYLSTFRRARQQRIELRRERTQRLRSSLRQSRSIYRSRGGVGGLRRR